MAETTYGVVTAGASYRALSDLLGRTADDRRILEGFMFASSEAFEFVAGPHTPPDDAALGQPLPKGATVTFNAVAGRETGWPLTRMWLKRSGATDATVIFNGVVL